MSRKEIIGLFVAGIIFSIVLALTLWLKLIDTAQAIQIIISFVLVLITAIYVKRTSDIAKATKEQAEATRQQAQASVKMAEEMREQRYAEALPVLVPDINPGIKVNEWPYEIMYQSLQTGRRIKVAWHNMGKGAAINSRFSLWCEPLPSGKVHFYPPRESLALESGGEKEIDFEERNRQTVDKSERYQPRLLAEYNDIYERKITTVQEFRIVDENQHKRAFTGELYFLVDGKRLGEEVTK